MSTPDVESYLAGVDEPKRATLQRLREDIRSLLPDAEEVISYDVPAFRLEGKVVAGFAAFKNHLSYLPFSGSVLDKVPEAKKYGGTKSALHFAVDEPPPKELVKKLVDTRLQEIRAGR